MKFNFTKNEVKELYDNIYFSDIQKRILEYRLLDYSIVKISDIEHCSVSTINREIRKIKYKIKKYNQIVAKNWHIKLLETYKSEKGYNTKYRLLWYFFEINKAQRVLFFVGQLNKGGNRANSKKAVSRLVVYKKTQVYFLL